MLVGTPLPVILSVFVALGPALWIRRVLVELRAVRALAPLARRGRAPAASGRTRRAQEGQSQNGAGSLRHSGLFRGCFSRSGLAASFADRTASPVRASNRGPRLGLSSALPKCLPLANRRIKRHRLGTPASPHPAGRSLGHSPRPILGPMGDVLARLQSALGDAYRIEKELGGGGMSRVFLAQERELERQVVVKVLPPEMAAGLNAERFRREIQLAASLQHPHIVPLLAAGHAS